MLHALRRRLSYANVTATVALFAALGGGAYAAVGGVPDSAGVFHGCVSRRSGALRVVASARSCHRAVRRNRRIVNPGEFAVAWNQRGPQGSQGAPGRNGLNGAAGQNGVNGAAGQNGVNGQDGAPGSAVAYAHILTNGTVDAARSKNVDVVQGCGGNVVTCPPSHGSSNLQCFHAAVPVSNAVVTPEYNPGSDETAEVVVPGRAFVQGAGGCPPGYTDAEVELLNAGAPTTGPFYIAFN